MVTADGRGEVRRGPSAAVNIVACRAERGVPVRSPPDALVWTGAVIGLAWRVGRAVGQSGSSGSRPRPRQIEAALGGTSCSEASVSAAPPSRRPKSDEGRLRGVAVLTVVASSSCRLWAGSDKMDGGAPAAAPATDAPPESTRRAGGRKDASIAPGVSAAVGGTPETAFGSECALR